MDVLLYGWILNTMTKPLRRQLNSKLLAGMAIVFVMAAFMGNIYLSRWMRMQSSQAMELANAMSENILNQDEMARIFELVQHGQLAQGVQLGAVALPAKYVNASKDGKIYVTRNKDLLMVLFPSWLGKGSNLRGYLYCSRELVSADVHKDTYEQKNDAIDVAVPSPLPSHSDEVVIEKTMAGNCYYVSRNLD